MSVLERRLVGVLPSATGIYVGAGLLAVGGIVTVAQQYLDAGTVTLLFYLFMDVLIPLGVIAVGAHLSRTDLSRGDVAVATAWFVGGVAVLWTLYTWAVLPDLLAGESLLSLRDQFVLYGNLGGAVGLVAGINRARARQNERLAARTTAQQETLEFINHLLRHNVLNGLQVIGGYTDLLAAHVDDDGDRLLGRIDERSDHMTDLVDNVRMLMRTLSTDVDREPVDVATVLETEVRVASASNPDVTFETDLERGVVAAANPTIAAVFENLLTNAVVHNDAERRRVEVTLESGEETARIRFVDNGPGIPERYHRAYLGDAAPSPEDSGEGLGLYLVTTLVDQFDGTVAFRDAEPRGSVVVVELPLAETADAANARQ